MNMNIVMNNSYILLALAVLWVAVTWLSRFRRLPLPPGPKPLPVIGNILDMPTSKPWDKYREWCNLYSKLLVLLRVPACGDLQDLR